METAEEFIRNYLREKADLERSSFKARVPFYEKYFTNDWNAYRSNFDSKRRDEEFVMIEIVGQTARAITIQQFRKMEDRHRYILGVVDGQWKIFSKQSECVVCRGSGERCGSKCKACDGNGWKDYLRD